MERKPRMAKIFELNTKNGSVVMAKMAGMLSKAKSTSVNSINSNTRNKGVATNKCFFLIKKRSFSTVAVMGTILRTILNTNDFWGSNFSAPLAKSILTAV